MRAWLLATAIGLLGAVCIACETNCGGEYVWIVAGEYTIAERIFASENPSDAWTGAVIPGAKLNIDLENNTMTVTYEREGTTYQVVYDL